MDYAFIYRISLYESNRHLISNTDMYYLNPEDTNLIYERCWNTEVVKVEYIRVLKNSVNYNTAYENSYIVPLRRKVKEYYSNLSYEEINIKDENELKQMIMDYEKIELEKQAIFDKNELEQETYFIKYGNGDYFECED